MEVIVIIKQSSFFQKSFELYAGVCVSASSLLWQRFFSVALVMATLLISCCYLTTLLFHGT